MAAAGAAVEDLGLTSAEAAARLARDGPNSLPAPARRSAPAALARQLVHFFALMLWAASALALVGGLPQLSVAIAVVVVLNAVFSFVQERRADRAAERLRQLLPRQVGVRRDGVRTRIHSEQVVVGDVLLLEAGDRVPADATVLRADGVMIDASMLTGESASSSAGPQDPVHAGTFVVEGDGEALVTATGGATELAAIARMTTETESPRSPLTAELHRVVRVIAIIAVVVGGGFFLLTLLLGSSAQEGFLLGVGVTVALVPEALLPTVTLALAWGSEQMAHRQVLVRNLEAVETLGSTTYICTDKTGTITSNRMSVVEVWTPGGTTTVPGAGWDPAAAFEVPPSQVASLVPLAAAAARCSSGHLVRDGEGWRPRGDPMEVALDVLARRLGVDTDAGRDPTSVVARFAFDPRRRRMSVVTPDEVLVKGAPDAVLPVCGEAAGAQAAMDDMAARGLRVLAVARRGVTAPPGSWQQAEVDLELLGLMALEDPPREGVVEALESCRRAGVAVAMITGDHPATASAIATEVGLHLPGAPVLVGDQLPEDQEQLAALLDRDGLVVARVSPEQKLAIAGALRSRGHVVAMTGDGVNDGPALREADIGIAMGASGTDVAREAADLVLLDDHFASIVGGIEQGRATFLNVRRFLTYHLTDNVAELTPFVVWALSGGSIPLALGVLQILALDIGTDTFSAVALGAEPPRADVLRRPPITGRLLDRTVIRRAFLTLGPVVAAVSMAAFFVSYAVAGWSPGEAFPAGATAAASGATFMAVVFGQAANAFACRSASRSPGTLGWTSNRLLVGAVATGVAISLLLLVVPVVAEQLGHEPPPLGGWLVALSAAPAVLGVDALAKWVVRRRALRRAPLGVGPLDPG